MVDLFNFILEKEEYNLNKLVKGSSLVVDKDMSQEFLENLNEFLNIMPDVVRKSEDKKNIWQSFENLEDYENNKRFINWLKKFVEVKNRPIEEASFINELNFDTFKEMSKYCFDNFIIREIGKKNIDAQWDNNQMTVLKKIIFIVVEMVVIESYSDQYVFENIQETFRIEKKYCLEWLQLIEGNEDRLWKRMIVRRYKRIENKLDEILDRMDEMMPDFETRKHVSVPNN